MHYQLNSQNLNAGIIMRYVCPDNKCIALYVVDI